MRRDVDLPIQMSEADLFTTYCWGSRTCRNRLLSRYGFAGLGGLLMIVERRLTMGDEMRLQY